LDKEILINMNTQLSNLEKSKEALLEQGVEKLKIMGFTKVTIDNILTDEIYHLLFLNFLNTISNPKNNDDIIAKRELKSLITKLLKI